MSPVLTRGGQLRAAPEPAIVVLAKAPDPGRVKTRLCPPLTLAAAAALHRACLRDLWARLAGLSAVRRVLCYDPPESAEPFRELLGRETDLLPQAEGDLGERLAAAFETLFARGLCPVLALGADSPDLPLSLLLRALRLLQADRCDVALGPALDGGYTLIGMNRLLPELFRAIPWSTESVLAETRDRCVRSGLRLATADPWEDVDDAASLARLQERVLARPSDLPHLHRFFQEHPYGPHP